MMKWRIVLLTCCLALFCLPGVALAGFDEYGYDFNRNLFVGTLENWDAYIYGESPAPVPPGDTPGTIFLARKWDKKFEDSFFYGKPWKNGAWLATYGYMHLDGEQEGSLWQAYFIYSIMSKPPAGAVPVPGLPDAYFIIYKEWVTAPDGNETILAEAKLPLPALEKIKFDQIVALLRTFLYNYF